MTKHRYWVVHDDPVQGILEERFRDLVKPVLVPGKGRFVECHGGPVRLWSREELEWLRRRLRP